MKKSLHIWVFLYKDKFIFRDVDREKVVHEMQDWMARHKTVGDLIYATIQPYTCRIHDSPCCFTYMPGHLEIQEDANNE